MKRLVLSVVVCAGLAACGTSVPLTEVPVADASGKPVGTGSAGSSADSGSAAGRTVVPVDLGNTAGQTAPSAMAQRIVYFDYDSSLIKPEFQSLISQHANLIKSQAGKKVVVEGHTDETGGREYNLALGQRRAEAVVTALGILGVPRNQLEAVSFGEEKPADPGPDEAAHAKNRRAEIRYQ